VTNDATVADTQSQLQKGSLHFVMQLSKENRVILHTRCTISRFWR